MAEARVPMTSQLPRGIAAAAACVVLGAAGLPAWSQGGVPTLAAPLEVVHDSGRGVPLAPYLSTITSADPKARGSVMPGLRFPITTTLAVGVLSAERRVFDRAWQVQPIFLIGADPRSLRWLAFNRTRLVQARAWGVVVQARDEAEFRAIQAVAPELTYAPSVGTWLDAQLQAQGIVYPVLIDEAGTVRQILIGMEEGARTTAPGDLVRGGARS